jgi:hypothetical protein
MVPIQGRERFFLLFKFWWRNVVKGLTATGFITSSTDCGGECENSFMKRNLLRSSDWQRRIRRFDGRYRRAATFLKEMILIW